MDNSDPEQVVFREIFPEVVMDTLYRKANLFVSSSDSLICSLQHIPPFLLNVLALTRIAIVYLNFKNTVTLAVRQKSHVHVV